MFFGGAVVVLKVEKCLAHMAFINKFCADSGCQLEQTCVRSMPQQNAELKGRPTGTW